MHTRRGDLALIVGQKLRITHARKVFVARHDRGNRHGTGPRTTTDFVNSHDDPVACSPAFPFDSKRRIRSDHNA